MAKAIKIESKDVYFMLCEMCSEKQASFIISAIVDSKIMDFRVCEDCAIGNTQAKMNVTQKAENICPYCHCGYYTGNDRNCAPLLGCSDCYTNFHDRLIPLLRRIHGNIKHKGKSNSESQSHSQQKVGLSSHFISSDVSTREAEWMRNSGPDSDVVVSSRIRLARNLDGFMFCNVADQIELMEISAMVERASAEIAKPNGSPLHDAYIVDLEDVDDIDRAFLMERHLISHDLAEKYIARKVIIDEKEIISIMINEEDHIRLQAIGSGLQIKQLWNIINDIDNKLARRLDYSFSPELGFLTACPTNVGTGLRVSVMFHLPALSTTREGKRILNSIANMGYAIRGIYGEGSRTIGAFYQISNEATLGQSEEEILDRMRSIALQILSREREERQFLIVRDKTKLEDIVFRAYAILTNAKIISSSESLELLSWVSLGVSLGIISGIKQNDISRLLILTRPAHLQKLEGEKIDCKTRDINRAEVIGKILGSGSNMQPTNNIVL